MARYAVAFDCETHLIQPGLLAPPLVCASIAVPSADGFKGRILDKTEARAAFRRLLRNSQVVIVGANVAYDMLVMAVDASRVGEDLMPEIFAAYEAERVFDVQIAESLDGLSRGLLNMDPRTGMPLVNPETGKRGRYSLATVTDIRTGRKDAKVNDKWRGSYALLEDTPIAEWPFEARQYPVDDAINTLEVGLIQVGAAIAPAGGLPGPCGNLHDLAAQVYSAFALHLGAAWGFTVNPSAVEALDKRTREAEVEGRPAFVAAGILREDGSQDLSRTKRLIAAAYGASAPCLVCSGTAKVPGMTSCEFCEGGTLINDCPECEATGRVPSRTMVQCKACGATGFDLSTAPVPRTAKDGVSYGRDTLAESGDELLMHFAAFTEANKIQSTYLPWLRGGIDEEGRTRPINLRPNVLLDTGRVSYDDVVQLLPRAGGVRECIVPRPGYLFGSVDYEGGELVTHAQSCLWIVRGSRMAEALVNGVKVHDALGATLAGISYDDMLARGKEFKAYRQAAKPANFGFPGGMGALKLVLAQRKGGPDTTAPDGRKYKGLRFCVLTGGEAECGRVKVTEWKERPCPPTCKRCIECAEQIREAWFAQWPENRAYFREVSRMVEDYGYVVQHLSKRIRGGVEFCAAANGFFQGLLADIAKRALRRASRECYVRGSALYGSRLILFAHDEIVAEHPRSVAADACARLADVMVEEFKLACPDLEPACKAAPTLMTAWWKGAEPVYNEHGVLIPWEPKS